MPRGSFLADYRTLTGEWSVQAIIPGMNSRFMSALQSAPAQPFGLISPPGPEGAIDVVATLIELRRLVGLLAIETNETPRSVLEEEFKAAPTDEFWRGTIGAGV